MNNKDTLHFCAISCLQVTEQLSVVETDLNGLDSLLQMVEERCGKEGINPDSLYALADFCRRLAEDVTKTNEIMEKVVPLIHKAEEMN